MKKIEKITLNTIAKVTKNVVEHEKKYQSLCPTIFHQPKRPEKEKNTECKK